MLSKPKEAIRFLFLFYDIQCIYVLYMEYIMGIVKISDELHEEIRTTSSVMSRSINSQAEFWIKIGRLCEMHPDKTFNDLIQQELMLQRQKEASLNE